MSSNSQGGKATHTIKAANTPAAPYPLSPSLWLGLRVETLNPELKTLNPNPDTVAGVCCKAKMLAQSSLPEGLKHGSLTHLALA
jgi:hypothetical protein